MTLVARERPAAGDAAGALVLLHGRGADENDLFPLLDALDPRRRLHGYTPRAPFTLAPMAGSVAGEAEGVPAGGAHWYVVHRVGFPDPETFAEGLGALAAWLDALPFPPGRVVLGGFSQGAVMSYAAGLGAGRPRPAALVALSGFLPVVDGWGLETDAPFPPVAIAHGTYDPVIPVELGRQARAALEQAGATPSFREFPGEHWVDPSLLPELRELVASAV